MTRSVSRATIGIAPLVMVALAAIAWPEAALAILGEGAASVERDRAHLAAHSQASAVGGHVVHELSMPNGEEIREFAGSDGTVFAVSWHGPARPDLRQLLGSAFDRMQTVTAARGPRHMRMAIDVHDSDLVVHSAGHPGAFFGAAYLPALTPADFDLAELQPQ